MQFSSIIAELRHLHINLQDVDVTTCIMFFWFCFFDRFAAALYDLDLNCWVMNVVPVSGFNTLPVIYDRGLLGVMHDW